MLSDVTFPNFQVILYNTYQITHNDAMNSQYDNNLCYNSTLCACTWYN